MAVPWLTLLKAVPWNEVMARAPDIADGARRLWQRVARNTPSAPDASAAREAELPPDAAAPWRGETARLRQQIAALQDEVRGASELIQAMADQQARLVAQLEAQRRVVRRLGWGLAAVAVVLAAVVASAWPLF